MAMATVLQRTLLLSLVWLARCTAIQDLVTTANSGWKPFTRQDLHSSVCPDWLPGYIQFHNEQRGKPDAKYLIYSCNSRQWCGGLGDRLRGIKYVLTLAYASDRVFLIDDQKPVPLEAVMRPNLINWTPDGINIDPASVEHRVIFSYEVEAQNVNYSTLYTNTRFIALNSNMAEDTPIPGSPRNLTDTIAGDNAHNSGNPLHHPALLKSSCLFKSLFHPSPELLEDLFSALTQLFNASHPRPYTAIHFRAGGMHTGETKAINRTTDKLKALVASLACARNTSTTHNTTGPILLLTDNYALRTAVREGRFGPDIITTRFKAVHIDQLRDDSHRDGKHLLHKARSVYVDLLLLAGARCLVVPTRSGFSNQAHMWGAQQCWLSWKSSYMAADVRVDPGMRSRLRLPALW